MTRTQQLLGEEMAIGNNISKLLEARKESISEFQRGMNISYTAAFALYHKKTTSITFSLLNRLCKYFGVGPGEIFPYTPDPVEKPEKK